jgi:hypothetical protein
MGLKPTQYRCASEASVRRFRNDGSLPLIHPLVDVCNAVSLAYAISIAVFDLDQVNGTSPFATPPDRDSGDARARGGVSRRVRLSGESDGT